MHFDEWSLKPGLVSLGGCVFCAHVVSSSVASVAAFEISDIGIQPPLGLS